MHRCRPWKASILQDCSRLQRRVKVHSDLAATCVIVTSVTPNKNPKFIFISPYEQYGFWRFFNAPQRIPLHQEIIKVAVLYTFISLLENNLVWCQCHLVIAEIFYNTVTFQFWRSVRVKLPPYPTGQSQIDKQLYNELGWTIGPSSASATHFIYSFQIEFNEFPFVYSVRKKMSGLGISSWVRWGRTRWNPWKLGREDAWVSWRAVSVFFFWFSSIKKINWGIVSAWKKFTATHHYDDLDSLERYYLSEYFCFD